MSKIVGFSGGARPLQMQRLGSYSPQLFRSVYVPPATRACGVGCCGSGLGTDAATNSQGHGFALGIGVGLVAGIVVGSFLRFA